MGERGPRNVLVRVLAWCREYLRDTGRQGGDASVPHPFLAVPLMGGAGLLLLLGALIELFRARWERMLPALALGIVLTWMAYQMAYGWLEGHRERKQRTSR